MESDLHSPAVSPQSEERQLVARAAFTIVAAAFLLRMLLVFLNYRSLPVSMHFEQFGAEMGWTARSIAQGQGFSSPFFEQTGPTALVPPLFPLLLASIFKVCGVYSQLSAFVALSLNAAFSSLTSAVIFFGLLRHFGYKTARVAAMLWAFYPYAIYFSAVYLWDFALTSLLFTTAFFLAWNRWQDAGAAAWAAWGVLAGLATLSNPSVLFLVAMLLAYAAWRRRRIGLPVVLRMTMAGLSLCLTLAPWCIRNMVVFQQPVLMRDGFWGEFYAGNCGDTSRSNPAWTHPASSAAELQQYRRLGEAGYMEQKQVLSLQRLKHHPAAFAEVSARRVLRFWTGYWSFSEKYLKDEGLDVPNVPFCTMLTLLMIFGAVRLYRRSPKESLPFTAAFAVFPLPYYITHASTDYRQPIEPLVVAVIAYGLCDWHRTFTQRKAARDMCWLHAAV